MTSILSDLVAEPPPTCTENAVSKIPLPKCLVESPIRTARSRTELRDINLAGVGCKWDQENSVNCPLYSISEPSTLFTTARIRGHGVSAAQAALTPISVNTFSVIDGATAQHDAPASQLSTGSSSSRFILCSHLGEMLSPEELPSLICERNKRVESMRLSTSLAGDSTFIEISSNGAYLENNAPHSTMKSCHSSEELHRTSSMLMEDAPLGSSDTESADQRSTKKDLFDASLLAEEDSDLVTFPPMTTSLFTHGELDSAFEDATEPENLFIVHNCREDPLHALEEQLEDDIQRDIEDEISKDIQHLSQKLANLQARHGAQRMSDGSMPSVLSCPVTPVLTPRIRLRKEANHVDHGGRHKRGQPVAARESTGREKPHQLSKVAVRKESLERRCSSSNARCAPSCESGQQEEHYGEDSPSSGSIRSHATDSTHNKPRARTSQAGVTSPQVFPNNNRRFEWVKTLRSGETGNIRHSKQVPTARESISREEKVSLESVKKKRVALLADMTRELETRLNELAVESASHWNVGRVVASRYNQPKRPEGYGCLDKRTAVHLKKVGLTRGPAGKSKPEKKGDKAPEKKSVGIQHDPSADQPSHNLEQTSETAYEAFVESPRIISEALDVKKDLHEEQADQGKISPGNPSEEQPSAVCKTVVRTRFSKRQPIKRTYIRCIEMVVDQSVADRSASGAIKNLSTSRIISEGEGCLSPNLENAGVTSDSIPHVTNTSQLSVISLHDKVIMSESAKPRDQPLRSTVFKLHEKVRQELVGCVQADMISGSSDLKAEKPPLLTLREKWDELIDGLEKERLTLPKIRTVTGSVVTSPRDSGGVKRITERLRSTEEKHFNPENVQDEDVINSCEETSQKSKPTRRLLQNHEEFIPQSDLEGFDLESFWCLVRESEDHVPTTTTTTTAHPPIAAVR